MQLSKVSAGVNKVTEQKTIFWPSSKQHQTFHFKNDENWGALHGSKWIKVQNEVRNPRNFYPNSHQKKHQLNTKLIIWNNQFLVEKMHWFICIMSKNSVQIFHSISDLILTPSAQTLRVCGDMAFQPSWRLWVTSGNIQPLPEGCNWYRLLDNLISIVFVTINFGLKMTDNQESCWWCLIYKLEVSSHEALKLNHTKCFNWLPSCRRRRKKSHVCWYPELVSWIKNSSTKGQKKNHGEKPWKSSELIF